MYLVRVVSCNEGLPSESCVIRRYHLYLKESSTEWCLDYPSCMGGVLSSQEPTCSENACCGDQDVESGLYGGQDEVAILGRFRHGGAIDFEQCNYHISHCLREANNVADHLAKLAATSGDGTFYLSYQQLPKEVNGLILLDKWQFPSMRRSYEKCNFFVS
ncbi:hypothetical protein H5410_019648 [Solanum commersonii]|uniref:Uncharacterized protein n=1 Tax=Solanum commersonii TaxID=4109 RepID=A0A9J5Z8Y1_SOLCO|nr:hypothetical protein H5410_019648 [Solanum commersonii]